MVKYLRMPPFRWLHLWRWRLIFDDGRHFPLFLSQKQFDTPAQRFRPGYAMGFAVCQQLFVGLLVQPNLHVNALGVLRFRSPGARAHSITSLFETH